MSKPACIAPDCLFYKREDEACILPSEEAEYNCPCLNGEFEVMYGENGELWDG